MTTHAKNLSAALDTQSDRRAGGVQYSTAKQAARELLRQEQAIADLTDALRDAVQVADFENHPYRPWRAKARAVLDKHAMEKQ